MDKVMIESKCVQLIKDNDRLELCYASDIKHFLTKHFHMKEAYRMCKKDLMAEAYKILCVDTIGDFADYLDKFGLLRSDVSELLDCTDYRVKKLAKEGKLKKVGESYKGKINYNIYDVRDVILLYINQDYPTKKEKLLACVDQSDENIAEALYIINKSAKKSRDTRNLAYDLNKHGVCHTAKTRSRRLYHLKDVVISKMIAENRASFLGIKRQIVDDETIYLKTYLIGDRQFHMPYSGRVDKEKLIPGVIEGMISAEKKSTSLNFNEAVNLLEEYSGSNMNSFDSQYFDLLDYLKECV